jgi:transcriptional regulator of met regulon
MMLLGLVLAISLLPAAVVAGSPRPRPRYSVRNVFTKQTQTQQRGDYEITFSDEGVPYEVPVFRIQLVPTPGDLDNDSLSAIESAMADYLLDELTNHWSDDDGTSELTDVSVTVVTHKSITTTRNRQLRSLETGTQLELLATLTFESQPLPSDTDVNEAMEVSLGDLTSPFVTDYLSVEAMADAPQLQAVTSGTWLSSSDGDDTTTTLPPLVDTTSTNGDGNGNGNGNQISQANQGQMVADSNPSIKAVYPAAIVGVAVFLLTVLFLAHRRARVDIGDNGSFDDEDDVSVDYEDDKDEIEVSAVAKKQPQPNNRNKKNQLDGNVDKMRMVESVPMKMEDFNTTIHIPPVTNSSSRVYDSSPMVLSIASSVGSSFDERDYTSTMLGLLPSTSTGMDDFDSEASV